MTNPRTAAEWREVQRALLADVEQWQRMADDADALPLPHLIGEDYKTAVREACNKGARAAATAADTAGLYAAELEAGVAVPA